MKGDKEKMTEKKDNVKVNILDILKDIRNGDAVFEASTELEKVIAGVKETAKAGKLIITLSIEPLSKGDVGTVTVKDDCVSRIPKPDKKSSIFFTTDDNRLLRDDPRQIKMKFKEFEEKK